MFLSGRFIFSSKATSGNLSPAFSRSLVHFFSALASHSALTSSVAHSTNVLLFGVSGSFGMTSSLLAMDENFIFPSLSQSTSSFTSSLLSLLLLCKGSCLQQEPETYFSWTGKEDSAFSGIHLQLNRELQLIIIHSIIKRIFIIV